MIFFWCFLDAISGTTPPSLEWSNWDETILDFIISSDITEADVSSHDVSIASIVVDILIFLTKIYIYFCKVSCLIASNWRGKSGQYRALYFLTGRSLTRTDSATENIPPKLGKGEKVV